MFPQGTVMDALPKLATAGPTTRIHVSRPGEIDPEPDRNGKNKPTHATTLGFAYVNEIGRKAFTQKPFIFPVGSMIVRETLLVRDASPDRLVVMIKHERSFNRKANGWEFLTVNGDATKVLKRQRGGKCLECHITAAKNDFVFSEDGKH